LEHEDLQHLKSLLMGEIQQEIDAATAAAINIIEQTSQARTALCVPL